MPERDWSKIVLRKRGEIVSREIAGEKILVPIKGKLADMQRIFSLNPVAAYVWDRLDGTRSLDVLLEEVLDHFEVKRGEAESDIREFVKELMKADLAEAAD